MASSVSYTSQIRDMADYAAFNGYKFVVYVLEGAELSSGIKQAQANGWLTIQTFSVFPQMKESQDG